MKHWENPIVKPVITTAPIECPKPTPKPKEES